MIDCSTTNSYIHERKRMCKDMKKINCQCCGFYNRIEGCIEKSIEEADAERAVRIVQNWSDRNPPKTLLTEFLERYPNAKLNNRGYPEYIIPCELGAIHKVCAYHYNSSCDECQDCWNTPINEESEETE